MSTIAPDTPWSRVCLRLCYVSLIARSRIPIRLIDQLRLRLYDCMIRRKSGDGGSCVDTDWGAYGREAGCDGWMALPPSIFNLASVA